MMCALIAGQLSQADHHHGRAMEGHAGCHHVGLHGDILHGSRDRLGLPGFVLCSSTLLM